MLNFKKLASTFIFSLFAFQSTVFAVPRYAKVVLLGGKGSGKTTIQKLINKDYNIENIPHTTQISYISVPVFYDNKGNFTFDEEEDRDVQRYNKEVILNICDTPAGDNQGVEKGTKEYENNENIFDCVEEFTKKKPAVIVHLLDMENLIDKNDKNNNIGITFNSYTSECLGFHFDVNEGWHDYDNCEKIRRLLILTHAKPEVSNDPDDQEMEMEEVAEKIGVLGLLKGFLALKELNLDSIKMLTFNESAKEEMYKIQNKQDNKIEFKDNKEIKICKEINLKYISKIEEVFNPNRKEDLKRYADVVLDSIARSVYRYGINNLDFDSNNSDWTIIDGELKKGH